MDVDNHVLFSFGTWLSKGKNTWGTTPFEIVLIIVHLSITVFLAISRGHRLSDGLNCSARATTSQERVGSHETGRAIEKLSFKRACMRARLHFSHCLARRDTSKKEAQDASKKRSSTLQPEVLPKLKYCGDQDSIFNKTTMADHRVFCWEDHVKTERRPGAILGAGTREGPGEHPTHSNDLILKS